MKKTYANKDGNNDPAGKPSKVGEGYNAPFRGFINVNVSPEQKQSYVAWAESSSFWEGLQGQVEDGVNIGLKLDPKGDGYLASATQRKESSPNAGLCVTARASDAAKALGRLLFCLTLLSHAERWEDVQPMQDPERW